MTDRQTPSPFSRELHVEVDGKVADAVSGRFHKDKEQFVAVLEGKGTTDPLDRPFGGRRMSAVEGESTEVRSVIDVDILGHIFEQSITDLERLRLSLETGGVPVDDSARSEAMRPAQCWSLDCQSPARFGKLAAPVGGGPRGGKEGLDSRAI